MRTEITMEAIRAILNIDEQQYAHFHNILETELARRHLSQSGTGWEENWFGRRRGREMNAVVEWMITNSYQTWPQENMVENVRFAFRGIIFHMRRRTRELRVRARRSKYHSDHSSACARPSF